MSDLITWSPGMTIKEIEKQVILKAMKHYKNNRKTVSNSLGISDRTLDSRLSLYQKEAEALRSSEQNEKKKREAFLEACRKGRPSEEPEKNILDEFIDGGQPKESQDFQVTALKD